MRPTAMAAPAEDGLARIVRRLALVFALSVTIVLPGGYFSLKYSNLIEHVETLAQAKAGGVNVLASANPDLWMYELQRMEELLQRYPVSLATDRATVRDAAGNPLLTVGALPDAPVLARSFPVYDSGRVLGQVEIAHSYREVVFGTLVAALLGLLLGAVVYATLLVLPLRALRRVTAALVRESAALSASASRYRALAETTNDAIITADGAGTIVGWNPAAERMFGYTGAEVIGQALTVLIPQRYRAGHLEGIRRIQAGGERHVIGKSVELHGLTKAGGEFPLEVALSEWESTEGRFFAGIVHDITGRKRVELALARQKDLYDTLSQTNQAIVRITSREQLFPAVCRIAVEHGHFRFAWIGLIDKDQPRLKPVARYGEDAGFVDALDASGEAASDARRGLTGRTLLSGTRVVSNDFLHDPAMDPWHEAARRAGVRASGKFPIRQGGAVIGAINLYAGDPGYFTDELLATIEEMAIDVSFSLDNFEREAARERAIEALRESEARFRSLFENMLNGFAYCKMLYDNHDRPVDFVYLEVNKAFERLTGLKNVVGRNVTAVIPGISEANPELFEIYGRVASSGNPEAFEIDLKPLQQWFSASVYSPERGYFVTVFDVITERKKAEDVLRQSEEKLRAIFEGVLDGILVADVRAGTFLTANPAICRMLGYTLEEIVRLGAPDIHRQEDWPRAKEQFEGLLRGELQIAADVPVMRKDGSLFFADIKATPIRLGDKDGLLGVFHDVTERKQSELALRAAEEQFRGLVEQSIAGIFVIQDGKFAYVNPRLAEIHGYASEHDLIGTDPSSLVVEKDAAGTADIMSRLLEGSTTGTDHNLTAWRKDGSTVELGLHSARASYRGRPAVIGMMQDISEKKRAEEQIKRYIAQLESAFMSTVQVATTLSEMRDPYTAGHERHVAKIAVAIGTELAFDAHRLEGLRVAGYLHDIGKITIPSEILSKPGKLSPIEYELIKGHAQASYDVLKEVGFPWPVAEVALQHHERFDGSGYPQGLKGEAILIEARIMAVADVVEAMSSHRPYRPGLGIEAALAEIERGRGTVYDPIVADACLTLFREKGYAVPA